MKHEWAKIEFDGRDIWVSRDALIVDGVRPMFSYETAEAKAAELGGLLPTCGELDARWAAAGLHNLPHTGHYATYTYQQHSAEIDKDLARYEEEHGEPYLWVIGNVGKHFVRYLKDEPRLTPFVQMRPGIIPEYGWHADVHTKPHMPAPVHPSETLKDAWVIQRPWDSSHPKTFFHYPHTLVCVRYDAPEEWVEIGDEGLVVTIRRMSSRPTRRSTPHALTRSELIPPPPSLPSDMADTDPAPAPWLDETLTHGERKVVWLEEQRSLGVREQPDGSNNGPEISTYHRDTVRDGVPNFGPWLSKAGGHWCCSSASAADLRTRIHGDPEPFMIPRAAGWEVERDAKKDGTWRPAELAIRGEFTPEPGDVATMQRGALGSGKRHVVTVKRDVPERKGVITIGGNEGNRFGPDTFRLYSSLLGFREMVDDTGPRFTGEVPYQGEDVPQEHPDHVDDGNNTLVGWGPMDPDPWAPEEYRGVEGHSRRWKTTVGGVLVRGEPGPRRTKGKPITVGKVWAMYEKHIREAHELTGVPLEIIIGMLCTESSTDPEAERYEKHLNDWSFGCAQTLTSTAFEMAKSLPITAPRKPFPLDESTEMAWRAFLFEPRNSILCGVRYLAYNDERWNLLDDPVLAACAYNAGSPRVDLSAPWGLKYTRGGSYDHVDVFVAWYGDALAVLAA